MGGVESTPAAGKRPLSGELTPGTPFAQYRPMRALPLAVTVCCLTACIDTTGLEFGASNGYSAQVQADAPLAYWPLDEVSGGITPDVVNGHDAAVAASGTATFGTEGVLGTAVALSDGIDLFVTAGHPFGFEGASYSFEAWVRVEAAGTLDANLWTSQQGDQGYRTFLSQTSISHKRYDSDGNPPNQSFGVDPVALGAFTHVVITHDAGAPTLRYYIDGAPATQPMPSTLVSEAAPTSFSLATADNDPGDVIVIDEVSVYDYALDPDRVAAHYACATEQQCSD
jgi:Concanavalin A-like lectin/glucanases superfamily